MLINVDKSFFKNKNKNSVDKHAIKNIPSTSIPHIKEKFNPMENKKLNKVERSYNHIHTAYDKY